MSQEEKHTASELVAGIVDRWSRLADDPVYAANRFGGFDFVQRFDVVAILEEPVRASSRWLFGYVRSRSACGIGLVYLDYAANGENDAVGVDMTGGEFYDRARFEKCRGRVLLRRAYTEDAWLSRVESIQADRRRNMERERRRFAADSVVDPDGETR